MQTNSWKEVKKVLDEVLNLETSERQLTMQKKWTDFDEHFNVCRQAKSNGEDYRKKIAKIEELLTKKN